MASEDFACVAVVGQIGFALVSAVVPRRWHFPTVETWQSREVESYLANPAFSRAGDKTSVSVNFWTPSTASWSTDELAADISAV